MGVEASYRRISALPTTDTHRKRLHPKPVKVVNMLKPTSDTSPRSSRRASSPSCRRPRPSDRGGVHGVGSVDDPGRPC